jgi:hypothetical protein
MHRRIDGSFTCFGFPFCFAGIAPVADHCFGNMIEPKMQFIFRSKSLIDAALKCSKLNHSWAYSYSIDSISSIEIVWCSSDENSWLARERRFSTKLNVLLRTHRLIRIHVYRFLSSTVAAAILATLSLLLAYEFEIV